MSLNFGDLLSNALHEVKLNTRKKIGIIQDEIGYTFEPSLTGDAVESWRYRKGPPTVELLEQLAAAILSYGCASHDQAWLTAFLKEGQHPYPQAMCERHFPTAASLDRSPSHTEKTKYPAPPLSAYAPPQVEGFIGRRSELAYFQAQFQTDRLALICGMAGNGKTSLAAQLAGQLPDQSRVFWHPFHSGNLNPFIRRIAGFLAGHGRVDLWEMLEAARHDGIKPPSIETSLDTIMAQLEALDVTVCLDDLQYVDDHSRFGEFLARLQTNQTPLIITARRFPSFLKAAPQKLNGLSVADTRLFLTDRKIQLSEVMAEELHTSTGGNGAFLTLAAVVLTHAHDPARVIAKLAEIDDVERFLMEEVHDRLSANQQRMMEGIAILGSYPGTRDALEDMLNQRDVRRTLQELTGQFLLTSSEGEYGREYKQHQIIQAFYYEQPRRRIRRELHLRAAKFYEIEEIDYFKAAYHYAKGDVGERAAQLATKHLWSIVNRAMARPLAAVLDTIADDSLEQQDRFELWLTQAQLDTLLGDMDNAQELLQKAADKLQSLPQTDATDRLKGRVCLHMAELLERQSPPDALKWAQRGLDILPPSETDLTAALTIRTGTMMMHMGNFGGALETFETVQVAKLEQNQPLLIDLLMNFSGTHIHMGQLDAAYKCAKDALEKSRHQRDHFKSCQIASNLALIHYLKGNWSDATVQLEEAVHIAKRLGSQTEFESLSINLGQIYFDLGQHDRAWHHISSFKNRELAQDQRAVVAHILMARLQTAAGDTQTACATLNRCIQEARHMNDQTHIGVGTMRLAETLLVESDFKRALITIEEAISIFKQLGDKHSSGIAWRIKGDVLTAQGAYLDADAAYDRSLNTLGGLDKYQESITLFNKGLLQAKIGEIEEGKRLKDEAVKFFNTVGAGIYEQTAAT